MKKNIFIVILLLVIGFTSFSCVEITPSGTDNWYYIYIDGDTGRQVEVSYLQRDEGDAPTNNITVTETVTLPYYKETHFVDFIGKELYKDAFLKIKSSNDSTTRAIAFGATTTLEDGKCPIMAMFETANAVGDCAYCKDLSMDSVFRYLMKIDYKGYIEFSKSDIEKEVYLYK